MPVVHRRVERLVQLVGRVVQRALQLLEPVLPGQVLLQVALDLLRVELERVEALGGAARVVAVQRPVAAVDRLLLLRHHLLHFDAPVDARRVRDDERRAGETLRLLERGHRLVHAGADRDRRHVDVLVHHRAQAEVLLVLALAHRRELGDGRQLRRLRHLAAGVRVHLRVEHQHVDVLAAREDVVEAAVADVVRPAVAADHPMRLRAQHVALAIDVTQARVERLHAHPAQNVLDLRRVLVALVVLLAVLVPVGEGRRQVGRQLHLAVDPRDLRLQLQPPLLRRQHHAEAVLGVVLEQRAPPRGAAAVLVGRERDRRRRAAPHRRAAGRVRDHHPVAEQLRGELQVGRLATAGARARELHQRLLELAALHGVAVADVVALRQADGVVPVRTVRLGDLVERRHVERVVGTRIDAHLAAGAVERRHLDAVVVAAHLGAALSLAVLEAGRRLLRLVLLQQERPDDGVRTCDRAVVALRARVRPPHGDRRRDAALLELGGADRLEAARLEGAHRQLVALERQHRLHDARHEVGLLQLTAARPQAALVHRQPRVRVLDALQALQRLVDRVVVLVDHQRALVLVLHVDRVLEQDDRLVDRQHAGQRVECRLHDHVDALAEPDRLRERRRVDVVELELLLRDRLLDVRRQFRLHLLDARPRRVQHERPAVLQRLQHVVAVHVRRVAARQVVGVALYRVLGLDLARPEAHVRDGHAVALMRVENEVALRLQVGVEADRLDGRLAGADRAVGAEPPEEALRRAGGRRVDGRAVRQRRVRHVVVNADHVLAARRLRVQVVVHGLRHRRRELLRREPVLRAGHQHRPVGVGQRHVDVEVERHADGALLARPVQHRDLANGRRQRVEEVLDGPRPVEVDAERADVLAALVHVAHHLLHRLRRRPHADGDALRRRRAVVLEQLVGAARQPLHVAQRLLHDRRRRLVVLVGGDRVLEEDVRPLAGAADARVVRVEREPVQVVAHLVVREHLAHVVVRYHADLRHLGRRAVAVEEVEERDARLERRDVRREAEVHHLLHRAGAHHREAGLARRHHVRVVVEDGERVLRDGARRHVEDGRHQLAGEQVHVGDHEEEALRGGEGARQRAGGGRAVQRTRRPRLRLHHVDVDHVALNVQLPLRRPLVHVVAHRRRRTDRVDERDVAHRVRHVGGRLVAVHHHVLLRLAPLHLSRRRGRGRRRRHRRRRRGGAVRQAAAPLLHRGAPHRLQHRPRTDPRVPHLD